MGLLQYHEFMEHAEQRLPTIDRDKIERSMAQLAARYELHNKRVVSLGTLSYESYALSSIGGNKITTVSGPIDSVLEQQLQTAQQYFELESQKPAGFTLRKMSLDDPRVLTSLISSNGKLGRFALSFDLLWVSDYEADERRRCDIQQRAKAAPEQYPEGWDFKIRPWHDAIDNALGRLSKGGLYVHRFAAGGVDLSANSEYLRYLSKQLRRKGMVLLECYYLAQAPAIGLLVAVKMTANRAAKWCRQTLAHRPEVTHIYGRTELENYAERIDWLVGR